MQKVKSTTIQVNNYKISYSNVYEKWQVKKGKVVLEEFVEKDKAIKWAKEN